MQIEKIKEKLDRAQEFFIVIIFVTMTVVVLFNVSNRNIMQLTVGWPDELARFLLIWLVYGTVPMCFTTNRNFKLGLITTFVFKKENRIHQFLILVITLFYSAVFFWISAELCKLLLDRGQSSPGMGLPMWVAYGILPICFLIVTLRILIGLIYFKTDRPHGNMEGKIQSGAGS